MVELPIVGIAHDDPDGPRRLEKVLQIVSPSIIALEWTGVSRAKEELMTFEKYDLLFRKHNFVLNDDQCKNLRDIVAWSHEIKGYEHEVCQKYVQLNPRTHVDYIDLDIPEFTKILADEYQNSVSNGLQMLYTTLRLSLDQYLDQQRYHIRSSYEDVRRTSPKMKLQIMIDDLVEFTNVRISGSPYPSGITEAVLDSTIEKISSLIASNKLFSHYGEIRELNMTKKIESTILSTDGVIFNPNETILVVVGANHVYGLGESLRQYDSKVFMLDEVDFV